MPERQGSHQRQQPRKKQCDQRNGAAQNSARTDVRRRAEVGGEGEQRPWNRLRCAVALQERPVADPARRHGRCSQQRQHHVAAAKHQRARAIERVDEPDRPASRKERSGKADEVQSEKNEPRAPRNRRRRAVFYACRRVLPAEGEPGDAARLDRHFCARGRRACPVSLAQIAAIAAGGVAGLAFCRQNAPTGVENGAASPVSRRAVLFFSLCTSSALPLRSFRLAGRSAIDAFYRSGALVFGGGHVVLPLLRAATVAPGWVSDGAFLQGYGAAQAVPGPLFTFAAYLGAAANVGPGGVLGGAVALVALFLPGLLALMGTLPFWHELSANFRARAAMAGPMRRWSASSRRRSTIPCS